MARYRFVQVDVFTSTRFAGNPLAVILDGRGLSGEQMQAIAREMNLSETTFVLPASAPATADARVRIFTPALELPFAGHPTVGTAFVLARERRLGSGPLRLELGVGVVPVEISAERITMTQPRPSFGASVPKGDVARALGLAEDAIVGLPEAVSTGLMHLMVPVGSLAALGAIKLDLGALGAVLERAGASGIYPFAREGQRVRARMFAPQAGVLEDPATGSAAGPLGAYLVQHGLAGPGTIVIEQGVEMGRPSRIFVEVDAGLASVRVGGEVVEVIDGTIEVG